MERRLNRPMWVGAVAILSLGLSAITVGKTFEYHNQVIKLESVIQTLQQDVYGLEIADCINKNARRPSSLQPLTLEQCKQVNRMAVAAMQRK